jgi:Rrf2 family transcriptional regulator, iron-sulfur cluster assembly transcription factor
MFRPWRGKAIMKLTAASSYAVHALVNLAGREQGALVASHLIAEAEGLPERFLLKVLLPLVRAQILLGLKGPHGGYRMARPANKITLLDVIEAVDGPIRGEAPQGDSALQTRLQAIYERVSDQARRQLGRVTVADLAGTGE